MDRRKLTFKAKSTLTNINAKEKRELYNRQKRKDARQETIMSRRDIAKEEKENQKKSTTVKESEGSILRKKQLEVWLKEKEVKLRHERENRKKPFVVGVAPPVVKPASFVCQHGKRATKSKEVEKTGDIKKLKAEVKKQAGSKRAAAKVQKPDISRPVTRSQTKNITGKQPANSKPTKKTAVKPRPVKANPLPKPSETVTESSKGRETASVDTWLAGVPKPISSFSEAFTDFEKPMSPYRFGGYDGQMKQTSGFTFTLRMDTKEKPDKTYNPKNSMVTFMRGSPSPSHENSFSYVPAQDLMNSPVLSQSEGVAACSSSDRRVTPLIKKLLCDSPKSNSRIGSTKCYMTRSQLLVSRSAPPPSPGVLQDVLNDSLEEEPARAPDMATFHSLHDREVDALKELMETWERKLNDLEKKAAEEESAEDMQEALDTIRSAVCQTRLLINEKLRQFKSLCSQAEDPNAVQPVYADDLQAFWDMVYLQVEDIFKKFEKLSIMEQNNWKYLGEEGTVKKKGRKKKASNKTKTTKGTADSDPRRIEQRKKLKELREKAKRMQKETVDEPILIEFKNPRVPVIFKTPKKSTPSLRATKVTSQVRRSLRISSKHESSDNCVREMVKFAAKLTGLDTSSSGSANAALVSNSPDADSIPVSYLEPSLLPSPPVLEDEDLNSTLDFLKQEDQANNCPIGQLISFTPTPKKTKRRKSRSSPARLSGRRGSIRMYSALSPRNRMLRNLSTANIDFCLTPVRRASRLTSNSRKSCKIEVEDLQDLPGGNTAALFQNPNLLN